MDRKINQKLWTRWSWFIVALFVAALPLSQVAAVDTSKPVIHKDVGYSFPDRAHLKFSLKFFNYHEDNSGFEGPVELMVNKNKILNLNDVWEEITDNRKTEKDVYKNYRNEVVGTLKFDTLGYKGVIALSNSLEEKDDSKWISLDIHIIFRSMPLYVKELEIGVKGKWVYYKDKKHKNEVVPNAYVSQAFALPTPAWPSINTSYASSKKVKFVLSGLESKTFANSNGKENSKGDWTYGLRFVTREKNGGNWPKDDELVKILDYKGDNNTASPVNAKYKLCDANIKQATVTLELDNYKAHPIYPLISIEGHKYTVFPNDHKDSPLTSDAVFYHYNSDAIWINGNPRPNSGTMQASYDAWDKYIKIEWKPEVYDKNHYNTKGKWVIYRNGKKVGTTSFSNIDKKMTFRDQSPDLEYEKDYTYTVLFWPNGWESIPEKQPSSTGLECSVKAKMERVSPFQDQCLTATNDLNDSIEIKCTFHCYSTVDNASYTIKLLKREATGKEDDSGWETLKTISIDDKTTNIEYTDKEIGNACTAYEYKATIVAQDNHTFESNIATGGINGATTISGFTASRGTHKGLVKLSWDVVQVDNTPSKFILERRLLGSKNNFTEIYNISGTSDHYTYDDVTAQTGAYYEYQVSCERNCSEEKQYFISKSTDGFALATGVISGRVSFGTGTAVAGVKVTLDKSSGSDLSLQPFHGMEAKDSQSYIYLDKTSDKDKFVSRFTTPWTMQMYLKIKDAIPQTARFFSTNFMNARVNNDSTISVGLPKGKLSELTYLNFNECKIKPDIFYNISLAYNQDNSYTLRLIDDKGEMTSQVVNPESANIGYSKELDKDVTERFISFGNKDSVQYSGVIDECRFWTKALTEEEVKNNYNRILSGSEDGLYVYYKLDEGITGQKWAYDYSKTDGEANGNHGEIKSMNVTNDVPYESQLSVCGFTDDDGNYTISGVPFSGDGTTYSIIPSMGVHSFSPMKASRFVSGSSLVYSGVDFTDESSFKTTGSVRFAGTTIPVEDCIVYIDGKPASKNGSIVMTDIDGNFEVSVPIGNHYIEVKKDGHTFVNQGRFPKDEDNVGIMELFDRERSNISFLDNTLVNFTGRVVGGNIEAEKPLGFKQSKNNIGVTEIKLTYPNKKYFLNAKENDGIFDINDNTVDVKSQTVNIKSKAFIGAKDTCQSVFITTDPETGEFSALLPPLYYNLDYVRFVNEKNPDYDNFIIQSDKVDLTNPITENIDSLEYDKDNVQYYIYHTALKKSYHTPAIFSVTQKDCEPDVFGISSYTVSDNIGELTVPVYEITTTESGKEEVTYNYNFPLFESTCWYTFNISAYEQYTNYDITEDGKHPTDIVKLSGLPVTISNALAAEQVIYKKDNEIGEKPGTVHELKENTIELDSLGKYTYEWMAGLPNISDDYSRAIQFYYEIDGKTYKWKENGLKAIILGALPTGNNFVTQGPSLIDMVLRDPPGSYSSASWTKGTTTSKYHSYGKVWTHELEAATTMKLGLETTISLQGVGFSLDQNQDLKYDNVVGAIETSKGENSSSWTKSTTIERKISTSSDPKYVGAKGDVFIGTSTNIIFGKADEVGLYRDFTSINDTAILACREVTTSGLSYGTSFQYSAFEIERYIIPNLRKLRNALLTTVKDTVGYKNKTDKTVYITTLTKDDERFGSDNDDKVWERDNPQLIPSSCGPSYCMVLPSNISSDEMVVDSVMLYNSSIKNWLHHLANNERQKVNSYEKRDSCLTDNLSFDGGATVTMTHTTDTTKTKTHDETETGVFHGRFATGMTVNGFGFETSIETKTGGGSHRTDISTTKETTTFSYTLQDNVGDALSVDVYDYDGWGPIFRTRGGQTSAPYEGKVQTSYYEPGKHVIMEATMQIEKPYILVDTLKSSIASNVSSGTAAKYILSLSNISETKKDLYYKLIIPDEYNKNGAILSMDGLPITGEGRIIKIPATETVYKTLYLEQSDKSILNYDNIAVVLASQTQCDPTGIWAVIADTAYVSAQFVPSSSDVRMALDKNVINNVNGDILNITFDQFDRKYTNLKSFRVQEFAPGSTDWVTLREYMIDSTKVEGNNQEELPQTAKVTYKYNMHGHNDGEYRFRVLSVSTYGDKEITVSSNEIAIVKDMVKPKPLGLPQPSDGILGIGDDISITFDEEIVKGALASRTNFEVTAVLNGAQIEHNTALALQGEERTAQTEADIPLAGKSFSADCWLLVKSAGTILSHGNGQEKFILATDNDGHLKITIGDETYTSEKLMPKDLWCYLTVSYKPKDKGGVINATVSEAANTTPLFIDQTVTAYEGVGTLSIGEGMTGAIHELTLWDVAHDNAKAQLERQKTKSPATANLMGYWKMNEGEGRVITDYARNRHLTSTGESWYINNENKAAALDGKAPLLFLTSDLAVSEEDNQAVEFWFKAGKQTGEAQLLDLGKTGLWLDSKGMLKFTSQTYNSDGTYTDNNYDAGTRSLADNEWHHLALNILRSGSTSVYVDGQRTFTTSSRNVASQSSDSILIGARYSMDESHTHHNKIDRHLTGFIDEVRIWNATMDAKTLANNRKLRLTGKESGLVAYFPFEDKTIDDYSQIVTVPTDTSLVYNGVTRRISYGDNKPAFTDDAPALQPAPKESNVAFSFTANNEKVVITIDEDPAAIEGCTINLKVKNVIDNNGNRSNPVCWSAYVSRNSLEWAENKVDITQKAGDETAFIATVSNKGGSQQEWNLSGLPQWLKANAENGIIDPLTSADIEFTVGKSCPIGKYAETIYLTNGDGIALPLAMNITVTGDIPDWTVDTRRYETSMSLVGTASVHGVPSNDPDDIVAAFIDGECRGVAKPTYSKRYDEYYVTLDIYGNVNKINSDKEKNVEFRIYDASTGIIWPSVETSQKVTFTSNAIYGSFSEPITLNALDIIQQDIALNAGWNWISLAAKPEDMSVPAVMKDIQKETVLIKNKNASLMNYQLVWKGKLDSLNNREMYKVMMLLPQTLSITGARPDKEDKTIRVVNGWNWIAFNENYIVSVTDGFAGLNPTDGDLVKGKQGFAIYDGYEWSGSLKALTPGQGYMYKSNATDTLSFNYPTATAQQFSAMRAAEQHSGIFKPIDNSMYPGNMTIVACVIYDLKPIANVEIGVFAGEECRTASFTDSEGLAYLTIPGSANEELSFYIPYNDGIIKSDITINYEDDGIVGNPGSPFDIDFTNGSANTGINFIGTNIRKDVWCTVGGVMINEKPTTPGVYFHFTTGENRKVEKVVIK